MMEQPSPTRNQSPLPSSASLPQDADTRATSEPLAREIYEPVAREVYEPVAREVYEPVAQSITVEIYGQMYHLRGVDPGYIENLATVVDAKMRAVSAHGGTVDSLRVAVLAALNIADELNTVRQRFQTLAGDVEQTESSLRNRADSLSGMLDDLLKDSPVDRRVG